MKMMAGLFVLFALSAAMSMPETGSTPPNAVSFDTVRAVALNWAAAEFPGAKLGAAIPYVDENGNTVAWMFHFRIDGKSFPAYDQVAADVQAERKTLTVNHDLSRWHSKYGHILVSARRDQAPVISFGYGTSVYYAIAANALERAQPSLGAGVRLSRIYFINPSTYLEVEDASGRRVVMSEHFEKKWDSREAFAGCVTQGRAELRRQCPGNEEAVAKMAEGRWAHMFDAKVASLPADSTFVPNYLLAPFYDWSYGCSPTSGAMVCGYVDRFQKAGRLVNYYFQRHDAVEGEQDYQIPDVQYECAIDMHTDTSYGGTQYNQIEPGLNQVALDNNYDDWSLTNVNGGSGNDYCWSTITSAVNAGHAMVWSVDAVGTPPEGHSLAAFGYRSDKYVYVHNTWYEPGEWWEHASYGNAHVVAVTPGVGDAHDIRLTYPLGDTQYNHDGSGEVLYDGDTCRITWVSGTPGTKVDIDVSTDEGHNWTSAAVGVADSGAYHWYVPGSIPTCDSVRLRLTQYNGATVTSGDGTFGNLHTVREPQVRQLSPANGQLITSPPIVLVVDSGSALCDSFHFKFVQGTDTLLQQNGLMAHCPLPDSFFAYNKTYKWLVRGHNQFGWGPWSTTWSFRTMFSGVEEAKQPSILPVFSVPAVSRLNEGSVRFDVRVAAPDSRLMVYDALGNVVRELTVARPSQMTWDMTDASGRKVAAGLYFARLAGGASEPTCKLVLLD
ncbi:MAG TPA: FlgD immunoglobulin-like domain containing protein [bacterium]|nr:FlgD immunoglobulin-like domain containing protein [bacterium]